MDALLAGTIDIADVGADLAQTLVEFSEHQHHLDHQYALNQAARKRKRERPTIKAMTGKSVYLSEGLAQDTVSKLGPLLVRNGMTRSYDRLKADIIAVSDLANIGQRNTWAAFLAGLLVCSPLTVETGGKKGPSIQFKSVRRLRRVVWASDEFKTKHAVIWNIISTLTRAGVESKWQWFTDKGAFLEHARNRKYLTHICFLALSEKNKPERHCSSHAYAPRFACTIARCI